MKTADERVHPGNVWQTVVNFPLTRILLAVLVVGGVAAAAQIGVKAVGNSLALQGYWATALGYYLLYGIVSVLATYVAYRVYVHTVERRPLNELSHNGAVQELAGGLLLGAGLIAGWVGILWLLGYYRVTGTVGGMALIIEITNDVASGFLEEILLRTIVFRITQECLGTRWALSLSVLLFGLLHLGNAEATAISVITVALQGGLLLSAAYVLTRRLWLSIGVHIAWDLTQSGIFGVAVSGSNVHGLLRAQLTGPTLLSGGNAGAEGSLLALVACLGASGYLLRRAHLKVRVGGLYRADRVPV